MIPTKKLTILILKIKPPTVRVLHTKSKNILFVFKDYFDLEVSWIVFQPNEFNDIIQDDFCIIDFHKSNDAVEIIDKIRKYQNKF